MTTHTATIHWSLGDGEDFARRRYSRAHAWRFDGGMEVRASASPSIVPAPFSDAAAVDPEEALIAAAASCHMLFFLHFAAEGGFTVVSYTDAASGTLGKNDAGRMAITAITLDPQIVWKGTAGCGYARRPSHPSP